EVRSVRRIADEHDVLVMPARVGDRGEASPQGAVLDQAMPVQPFFEERFAKCDRLVLARAIQTGTPPRLLAALDDERGDGIALAKRRRRRPRLDSGTLGGPADRRGVTSDVLVG